MLNPDFRDMLSAFIAENVEFLIVGAYALSVHGVPRATGDLDCWVRRTEENGRRILRALEIFGAPTAELSIADLTSPDVVFQIGLEPNRIDILTSIDGIEFDDAWSERVVVTLDGVDIPVLSLRHMIANKRAVARPRDLGDVIALESEQLRRSDKKQGGE